MLRYILFIFISYTLFSCRNYKEQNNFFQQNCSHASDLVKNQLKKISFPDEKFGVLIPQDWEVEKRLGKDSSKSIVGLDTFNLYSNNRVRSIALTKYGEPVDDIDSFFQSSLIAVEQKYKLIDHGKLKINKKSIPWLLIEDDEYYSVTYYIESTNLFMINTTVSIDSIYLSNLCELTEYVKTIDW